MTGSLVRGLAPVPVPAVDKGMDANTEALTKAAAAARYLLGRAAATAPQQVPSIQASLARIETIIATPSLVGRGLA